MLELAFQPFLLIYCTASVSADERKGISLSFLADLSKACGSFLDFFEVYTGEKKMQAFPSQYAQTWGFSQYGEAT